MKWLIVEDALKNQEGHWKEYIDTFRGGLRDLNHEVTILADHSADASIAEQREVHPVLPDSIWHRMGDDSSRLQRHLRVPVHAWQTIRALKNWLRCNSSPDVIFVPTVLVHHLLAWWRLYERVLKNSPTRLLLFFPNTPVKFDDIEQQPALGKDPTSKLFAWLIRRFASAVQNGRVILGVETNSMREAMTKVTGVPFTYLPHPVAADHTEDRSAREPECVVSFGCYGAARFEKGSDLLQSAINKHLKAFPDSKSKFTIQWLDNFKDGFGRTVKPDTILAEDDRVTYIDSYFGEGEYERQLECTDVILLPYREPYRYRVSRVVIEAMVAGIPVVATNGTTLWEQACEFGSGLPCELDDVASLATAIRKVELQFESLLANAREKAPFARKHFSVATFAQLLDEEFRIRLSSAKKNTLTQ